MVPLRVENDDESHVVRVCVYCMSYQCIVYVESDGSRICVISIPIHLYEKVGRSELKSLTLV